MPTLKRGQGMSTHSKEWSSPSAEWEKWPANSPIGSLSADWEKVVVFVPNGKEVLVGKKKFFGQEYLVFKCLDDSFMAQARNVCEMEDPTNPMKVLSLLPEEADVVLEPRVIYKFSGTNWKLCSDRKWEVSSEYIDLSTLEVLGTKMILEDNKTIYRGVNCFIAC